MDINGEAIVSHLDFPENGEVLNLEVGAGTNFFGKKFFPLCYLCDLSEPDFPHFDGIVDYENKNVHYLDYVGDFYELNIDRTFNKVIFCNPYLFGLQSEISAKKFLNKIGDLLAVGGEAMILGHHSNGWASYRNATRRLRKLKEDQALNYDFNLSNLTSIDNQHDYQRGLVFRRMINSDPTIVTECYNFIKTA
jgi:hypothetical protein